MKTIVFIYFKTIKILKQKLFSFFIKQILLFLMNSVFEGCFSYARIVMNSYSLLLLYTFLYIISKNSNFGVKIILCLKYLYNSRH